MILALVLGLAVCYAFGTAWFMIVYAKNSGSVGLLTALGGVYSRSFCRTA